MISVFYNLWLAMYMDFFIVCLDWHLITYNLLCCIVRFEFAVAAIQGWGDAAHSGNPFLLWRGGYTGVGRRASWMRIGIFRCDGAR